MSAPEYAFIASDGARQRARGAVLALNSLGYDARRYDAGSAEARRAKAVVFCGDVAPDIPRFVFDVLDPCNAGMGRNAWAVTAPTLEIAQAAARSLGRPVELVPEPVEGTRRPPRAARAVSRSRPLEWLARRAGLATDAWRPLLLWTGEEQDLETLVGAYPALERLGAEVPLALHCVAAPELLEVLRGRMRERPEVRLTFEGATPQGLARALEACDFVLLPATPRLEREVLHAGRLAVGGEDPCQAIRRALAQPRETLEQLERAQRELDETHAPAVVARAWVRLFMRGPR